MKTEKSQTYTVDEVAVASRALDLLIFLACSRTLDLASSMDALEPATVERARAKLAGVATFEAADTRILEAERDMLAATATEATTTGAGSRPRKTGGARSDWRVYIPAPESFFPQAWSPDFI